MGKLARQRIESELGLAPWQEDIWGILKGLYKGKKTLLSSLLFADQPPIVLLVCYFQDYTLWYNPPTES